MLSLVLAALLLIDSGDFVARGTIDKVVSDECDALVFELDENGAFQRDEDGAIVMRWPGAFCGWQMTDVSSVDGIVTARVQVSIGCDGVRDLSTAQETEFWYSVKIEDGSLVRKDRIDFSPQLVRNGTRVAEFTDPEC